MSSGSQSAIQDLINMIEGLSLSSGEYTIVAGLRTRLLALLVQLGLSTGGTTDIGCRVFNSANISIPDAVNTALTFDSESYDTDSMHSTTVNTGRITINTAGKYLITSGMQFDSNINGVRYSILRINGATVIGVVDNQSISAGDTTAIFLTTIINLVATDFIEFLVYQDSGAPLNVLVSSNNSPIFAAQKIV